MKKIISFLPACLVVFSLFTGCESDMTVKEFFKTYTEEAAIELIDYNGNYQKDEDGITSISSEEDKVLTFYLRNPQKFTLNTSFAFSDITLPNNGINAKIEQDKEDKSIIRITFNKDFLQAHEYGLTDLGGTINISQQIQSGTRPFESYSFDVRCNTEPPAVRNLTVLQYTKAENDERYVLAFNMPDMSSTHTDISKIKINGVEYSVTPVKGNSTTAGISETGFTTDPSTIQGLIVTGKNKVSFAGENDDRAVYFLTDVKLSDKSIPFDVELFDNKGLHSISSVSALSEKLELPTCSSDGNLAPVTDENGYYEVSLNAPSTNSDAYVYYEVYDKNGTLTKKSYDKGTAKVNLAPGSYSIKIWAHKSGYVDSDIYTTSVSISGVFFVDTTYTPGDGETSDGGKYTPFQTIGDALSKSSSEGFERATIILLSDVELDSQIGNVLNPSYNSITINGQSKYYLKCKESGNNVMVLPENIVFNAVDLALGSIRVVSEGSIILTGSTCSYDDSTITLSEVSSNLYVNNLTGTKPINVKYKNASNLNKHKVVLPYSGSSPITDALLARFTLNTNYYLVKENGYGVANVSGFTVQLQNAPQFEVTVTQDGKTGYLNKNDNVFTCKKGTTLKVSVKDSENNISINNIVLSLDLEGDNIIAETSGGKITINPSNTGTYTLVAAFSYEGLSYSAQLTLKVEAQ